MRGVGVVLSVVLLIGSATPALAQEGSVGVVDTSTGEWFLLDPSGTPTRFFYGNPGDIPMVGDWDCDGDETRGLYRQSDGFVYLRNSNMQGSADIRFFFGNPGDLPLAGDFNGDGCDSVSIYRPAEARFYIINALGANDGGLGAADLAYVFGDPGDKPFVGDFDDDTVDEVGLHRETTGLVYFRLTHSQGNADSQFIFGDPGDKIVAAEWSQRGSPGPESVGLFRPSNCTVYLRYTNSQGQADKTFGYGVPNGLPFAGDFGVLSGNDMTPGCFSQPVPQAPPPPHSLTFTESTDRDRCEDAGPSFGFICDFNVSLFQVADHVGDWIAQSHVTFCPGGFGDIHYDSGLGYWRCEPRYSDVLVGHGNGAWTAENTLNPDYYCAVASSVLVLPPATYVGSATYEGRCFTLGSDGSITIDN